MDDPPGDGAPERDDGLRAETHELRRQVMRLLRVEADLFHRNEQLGALWKIYQSLSELGKRLHGKLGEAEIGAAIAQFALYSLNLERSVVVLEEGARARAAAWDGYYDEEHARAIAALSFQAGDPLFDPIPPDQSQRLRPLPKEAGGRDAIGQAFALDEYALLPLREGGDTRAIGYLIAGNTAKKARHHSRIIADDPVVLALENLVDLASAALRSARLDEALEAERVELEARVEERTRELSALNERLAMELSERRRAEAAREELLSEVIRTQERRLEELSTPILPITEHILVMPLIGTMDAARATQLQSAALEGAAARAASFVILDVTGVKVVDASFAGALVKTAEGLRLLGVRAIVTGIRPEVAQALVVLDDAPAPAPAGALVTRGTLQSGIAYAMARARAAARVSG